MLKNNKIQKSRIFLFVAILAIVIVGAFCVLDLFAGNNTVAGATSVKDQVIILADGEELGFEDVVHISSDHHKLL